MSGPLPPESLRFTVDPRAVAPVLRAPSHARAGARRAVVGQERALRALAMGLGIRERGFHIFVVGPIGTGRTTIVREAIAARARRERRPDDWGLLHDFDAPDRPRAVRLPPGSAAALARAIDAALEGIVRAAGATFDGEAYRQSREQIVARYEARREREFASVMRAADREGFLARRTPTGFELIPREGERLLSVEEIAKLAPRRRALLERRRLAVQRIADGASSRVRAIDRASEEAVAKLDRAVLLAIAAPLGNELVARHAGLPALAAHVERVIEDLVERAAEVKAAAGDPRRADGLLARYRLNPLVDNARQRGAPVVEERHPTVANLLGRIRRPSEDVPPTFADVRAGALHRANGGYLILDALEVLHAPGAWDALKRALKTRAVEIETEDERPFVAAPPVALRPEPIPLEVKVVLIATRGVHAQVARVDPDFPKLFKIKAEFEDRMERTPASLERYAATLVRLARAEGLLPFDAGGLARAIEEAARAAGDRRRLTARLSAILDLAREADWVARGRRARRISARDVRAAFASARDRERALEDRVRAEIAERRLAIETSGAVVGQTNGLTVIDLGSYAFAIPARITARVFAGRRGLLDIERAARMAGPIHSKGVLILQGFLGDRFGRCRPLRLDATLVLEQSYGEVEGDSASLAEAIALLSVLSGVPVRQDVAITGSVDQRGRVQAVGAIELKIEGFFETLRARGPRARGAVIIPAANVPELMLREDVVAAVAAGRFAVIAVETIEEAARFAMGLPFGVPDARGRYPAGTLGARCDAQIATLVAAGVAILPRAGPRGPRAGVTWGGDGAGRDRRGPEGERGGAPRDRG